MSCGAHAFMRLYAGAISLAFASMIAAAVTVEYEWDWGLTGFLTMSIVRWSTQVSSC
jgi:hypothetical protein